MFTYEHTATGKININKLWDLYSNVDTWLDWNEDINQAELDGPFANGTTGTIQILIAPPITFSLENVKQNEGFDIVAELGDIKAALKQHIADKGGGEFAVTHSIVIEGENDDMLDMVGEMVSLNVPDTVQKLMDLAA